SHIVFVVCKMTDVEPVVTDFTSTGRTGRRNAMPDILGSSAGAGAADLSGKLAELSVKERVRERERKMDRERLFTIGHLPTDTPNPLDQKTVNSLAVTMQHLSG
uniref:Uncharacterized protein n=1 Tax=Myripristis murdjan TaxID=586833 RepID=A0A667Z5X4_9TELE